MALDGVFSRTAGVVACTAVPDAALSSNVPLKNANNTFTGVITIDKAGQQLLLTGTSPNFQFYESDAGVDQKWWTFEANVDEFFIATVNDALSASATPFKLTRSGINLSLAQIIATKVNLGPGAHNEYSISSGTLNLAAAGACGLVARDETNNVEGFLFSGTGTIQIGAFTNHPVVFYTNNTEKLQITADGRLYGTALHNNAGAVTGTTNQYVASGTYTPTGANVANTASITPTLHRWIRVGNVVHVAGRSTIQATAGASVLAASLTLPIASNIAATSGLSGSGARQDGSSNMPITIGGDATGDVANIVFFPENTSAYDYNYTFTYTVL